MKKLLMIALLPIGFVSCNKEDDKPVLIGMDCEELKTELHKYEYKIDSLWTVYTGPYATYEYIDTTKGYDPQGNWYLKEPYQTEMDNAVNSKNDILQKMEQKGCPD